MKLAYSMLATAGLFAAPGWAHHGWSGYDSDRLLKLSGTIEELDYRNPHGTAKLKTADGNWLVVLAPISRMEDRGLTREMLKPGTDISIEGYPHRTVSGELRAERISIATKTVELR